jgi:hypothetical protein
MGVSMGLDNVAVQWPRTGRFYEPVAPAEFIDFAEIAEIAEIAEQLPPAAQPAAALAGLIAESGTVHAAGYTELIDLLLGLKDVLYATDAAAEDEDPVIDPDGCAWIAGGLERFVAGHTEYGEDVSFDTLTEVMRKAIATTRLPEQQLRWLDQRIAALRDEDGELPQWSFTLAELSVLARFYRRCADCGFAVYADF